MTIQISEARTDHQIAGCFAVMAALRPHLVADDFVSRIRRQQKDGYRLVYGAVAETPCVVAGFRIVENLAVGRMLYVDDLVSDAALRGQGHGAHMLNWLKSVARDENCTALHLDSGVQRLDAHRFYQREGLDLAWYHFARGV